MKNQYPRTSEEANARAAEWRALAEKMLSKALAWPENTLWGEMAAKNNANAVFWENEAERLLAEEMSAEPVALDEQLAEIGKNLAKERP